MATRKPNPDYAPAPIRTALAFLAYLDAVREPSTDIPRGRDTTADENIVERAALELLLSYFKGATPDPT